MGRAATAEALRAASGPAGRFREHGARRRRSGCPLHSKTPCQINTTSSGLLPRSDPREELELRVSFDGQPDELWLRAFWDCWGEVKTFDARWGTLELLGQTVEVRGILEDADTEALRTELDAIVERANALAEEMRSEDTAAAARWQAQREESERRAGEMTDAFREDSDG